MSYKTILVQLDGLPRCEARVELSARMALEYESHLLGLAPTGLVHLPVEAGAGLSGSPEHVQAARAGFSQRARAAVDRFVEHAKACGVKSCEGRIEEDDSIGAIVAHGRCSDLVVVGQTDHHATTPILSADFPQQVLLRVGRPVLIVPYAGEFKALGGHVLVAWSDKRESVRALCDALPLLHKARKVSVVCFKAIGDHAGQHPAQQRLSALREWLARHGIASQPRLEVTDIDVGNAILSNAADLGADVIVSGAYGHSRLSEFILGGVTRTLLAHMTVPVLMSH
ncbi:MAG: universal stress protein [Burkholderiaceae bacterium]|nr:universal stress protein [Burkholderiaceae bacterium]